MVSSAASVASTRSTRSATSSANGSPVSSVTLSAPKPMPMAIMRNAHEVIRGAMTDIQTYLDQDDFESARTLWHRFHRYSDLHMKMEEGRKGCNARGLFRLVDDHADGAAKKAGLRHEHNRLYELEEDVVDIFEKAPDIKRATEVFPIFREENEAHLLEEENVLMPAIKKMIKQGVPVKKYIESDILPVLVYKDNDDLEFFIRFSNEILEKHHGGMPRVRVFDHGLWALASVEQWKEWDAWIQDTLSEETYQELADAIQAYKDEKETKQREASKSPPPPSKGILKMDKPKQKGFLARVSRVFSNGSTKGAD